MENSKVVVITGASSGMGYEAAKLFAEKGWQVFAGARRVEKIPLNKNITAIRLDVTDSQSNQVFVQQILEASVGRLDVLINNAGYGEFGSAEEVPMETVRKQFETNFFGVVELTQLILPAMRAQHSGRIINVSSIVGDIYLPLGAYYNSTKAALNQWSNVLDLEVSAFGVRSIVVQPGDTASSFGQIVMGNASANLKQGSVYGPLTKAVQRLGHRPGAKIANSADIARLLYKAATDERIAFRYYNAFSDRMIVHLARVHPRIYRKILMTFMKQVK